MPIDLALVRGLLERAIYDIERNWPAAAYDALGRAAALLEGAP